MGILAVGLYGCVAPFVVRRRTPLVPPRQLVMLFAVVVVYYTVRVVLLERPTYIEAKYSEWPETCLALALALWSAQVNSPGGGPGSVQRLETRSIDPGGEGDLRIPTRRTSSRAGTAGHRD